MPYPESTSLPPQPKVWGTTVPVYADANCEVHFARVLPRSYCSCHRHQYKWNLFYLLEGSLLVHFYANPQDPPVRTVRLAPGQALRVPPDTWHRFETLSEPAVLNEVYWAQDVLPQDILRFDQGGRHPQEAAPQ